MSISAIYVTLSSDESNHIDLGFDFPELSLAGQRIRHFGSSGIDSITLHAGVDVDFSSTGSGQDKVYLAGSWSDYKSSLQQITGSTFSLATGVDEEAQKVTFQRGFSAALSDLLVFSDGVLDARTATREKETAIPDSTNETSLEPDLPDVFTGSVRMINVTSEGLTFAPVGAGMSQEILGAESIDVVYVANGAFVNARSLGGGKDLIYLRGSFSEYKKNVADSGRITLTRSLSDDPEAIDESVVVSAGFGGSDDQLIFADGSVTSTRQLRSLLSAPGVEDPDAVTTAELGALWDATHTTPGVSSNPFVVSFQSETPDGGYQTGDEIVITATMNKDVTAGSTFDITLDTGAVVTLTAEGQGTVLRGRYTIGADDTSADLNVVSFTAGNVTDLEANAMTSTSLPSPASNLAGNHDIIVNEPQGLTLESVMNGADNLDVRSDIVLAAAGGEAIALTTTPGSYEIRLLEQAGEGFKSGFHSENALGLQTITVTVHENGETTFAGGAVSFDQGKAIIDFARDFDLANSFIVEADEGLFVSEETGAEYAAVGGNDVAFDTVAPTAEGVVAQIWKDASFGAGDTWFDGIAGDHFGMTTGLDVDLSGVAGVVVIGRDASDGDAIVLENTARVSITGFGADDRLYIDYDTAKSPKEINETTVSIASVQGGVRTVLLFSAEETMAAALITFENRVGSDVNENELVAAAFFDDSLPEGTADYSFQRILDLEPGEAPVIAG